MALKSYKHSSPRNVDGGQLELDYGGRDGLGIGMIPPQVLLLRLLCIVASGEGGGIEGAKILQKIMAGPLCH